MDMSKSSASSASRSSLSGVVNTSTGGAIYGDVDTIPSPESTPPAPMAGYGTSKFCAEQYCNLYARLHGLSTVTLRYGNVYGPRQDPLGEAGVIAIFCGKLMDGGRPRIYGDGRQTRDYVFVVDVAEATVTAATHSLPRPEKLDARGFNGDARSRCLGRPIHGRWKGP